MGRTGGSGVEAHGAGLRIVFSWQGVQQRKRVLVDGKPLAPTAANHKYAARLVAEIKSKIKLGLYHPADYFADDGAGPVNTVAAQLASWLAAQRIEDSTRAGYSSAIKFWNAQIGTIALRTLRYSDILKALATRPDLTGKTLNNYVSVLREALELAVNDGLLTDNPAAGVKRFKHQKEPPDPFTAEERDKIVAAFAARHPGQVSNLVELWFWSGLRTSEVFGLRWPSVDTASGSVSINEALVRGQRKDRTKTNVVRRVILNSQAKAALQRQRAHTQMADAEVFQDPRYGAAWIEERAFRRSFWKPVLKVLGIRYRRPYNMRHTYATTMLMAGMNPAFCARQLGHSVQVFLSTYARWIDGQQDDAEMARLEKSLAPPAQKEATR